MKSWLTVPYVTQRQLMRLFAVKLILSYEQKVKVGQNFSNIKVCMKQTLKWIVWVHKLKLINKWQEIMF